MKIWGQRCDVILFAFWKVAMAAVQGMVWGGTGLEVADLERRLCSDPGKGGR